MTGQAASSDRGLSLGTGHCRRLAERILAAVSARCGFVVVSDVAAADRRLLLEAITELAAGRFQIVEIARAAGARLAGPAEAIGRGSGAPSGTSPPLFLIDDAEHASVDGLRDICQTAPLSADWAPMLSVRAVLLTRFAASQLDFLAPRITASFPYDDAARPPPAAARPARASPHLAGPAAGAADEGQPIPTAPRDAAVHPASGVIAIARAAAAAAAAARRRDLRLCALLAYLIAVGALGGWYATLRGDGGGSPSARPAMAGRPPPPIAAAPSRIAPPTVAGGWAQ